MTDNEIEKLSSDLLNQIRKICAKYTNETGYVVESLSIRHGRSGEVFRDTGTGRVYDKRFHHYGASADFRRLHD